MTDVSLASNPPANTSIVYNGYTFPEYRQLDYKCEPVYDSSDRVRTGNKYTLEIHFVIASPDQVISGLAMPQIRCALTQPGQVLKITGLGVGNMTVGGQSPTVQVMDYGPKPRMLHLAGITGNIAFEAIWQCEWTVVECCTNPGVSSASPIDAWNNSVVYSIDDRGLTVRTVSGYFEIPIARLGNTVPISADAYRTQINVTLPPYFKRMHEDFRLSEDRRRIEFGIVDVELDGDDYLPPGIVRGSFERSLANQSDQNFQQWIYEINATFERAAGTSRDWAFQQWFRLVATTINTISQNMLVPDQGQTEPGPQAGAVIPLRIRMSTDCFTRTCRISCSLQIIRSTYDVITATGMWAPLNVDYVGWAATMIPKLWSARGNAQLYHDVSVDAIIDPCTPGTMAVNDIQLTNSPGYNSTPVLSCSSVTPNSSWLNYENHTYATKTSYQSIQNPTQSYNYTTDNSTNFDNNETTLGAYSASQYPPVIQQRGAPRTRVIMQGYAVRAKFLPSIPALLTFAGATVQEHHREIDGPRVVASLPGCDIYGVRWLIEYWLTGVPSNQTPIYDQPRPWANSQQQP